ncbi:MAG: thiamine pyrophosphate-dependent dehydrogenase E1 component subunit alpha [Solirubrobacterales bacterium]|nr:thiamine pyrophosphate-dependent dehydrogenase E1 component subunit alpha [Solirubrobacterales bacterium]
MLRIRRLDDRARELNLQGEIAGTIHTSTGQEAACVGATAALRDDDYITGTHRSHGHPIGKGSPVDGLMAELMGKSTGVCKGKGGSMHLADFSVGSLGESGIVGSGVPVAVGAGLSAKIRGTDQVALAFFGDGAAAQGAVHEAMNLAAVWDLPVIFLCENNHWAVTISVCDHSAVPEISQRGPGYAMPGVSVDGNDPVPVYEATLEAVERARAGGGPSIVEALTYRVQEHAQGLPISREYREQAEIDEWLGRDPIDVHGASLVAAGVLTETELSQLVEEVHEEMEAAIEAARAAEDPPPAAAFEDLYADEPDVAVAR